MSAQHDVKAAGVQREPGFPTLREALALSSLRRGDPRTVAGHAGLDGVVRWAHVAEIVDVAAVLRGGELVLTTGIALPSSPDELRGYAESLAAVGAAGVVIELGRRFAHAPQALIEAADAVELPLIVLGREVRFVEVTEAIHTLIVDARVRQLERSEEIHRRFHELTLQGASAESIVASCAELCGLPVVLENVAHQVLTYAAHGTGVDTLLASWERRSRAAHRGTERHAAAAGALTAVPVGARGEEWGRLVAVTATGPPTPDATAVLQRGAAALALNRLSERDETSTRVRGHQALLTEVLDGSYDSPASLHTRAEAVGVPLRDRALIGVTVTWHTAAEPRYAHDPATHVLQRGHAERVLAAASGRIAALVDAERAGRVRLVVSLPDAGDAPAALTAFAEALRDDARRSVPALQVTVGVGSTVTDVGAVRRSVSESEHVAAAAPATTPDRPFATLPDVRLRGLVHVLRHDVRLQNFVERELGRLVDADERDGTQHVLTLTAYLDHGRNKRRTAAALHLARPSLYARLERIEAVLDTDLDDTETCLSLHVALLGLASLRSPG